ncbi:MAG: elongation factor 1-beta [Nanoarchaeota archaeon]|nr:elongation factor 1-beta [Nanoarchaeota archaeon]MBU1445340.1 elongation factor 1-beta [Nanoarchaeota archaeon]MBU2420382.1 elongation factor 1-beta [Nanoarchaeota archaeon]MBU2475724.1 elongation factor 1-beta [Nanoarchaeota archaeon]
MANSVITIRIMPISPEVDLEQLKVKVKEAIVNYAGEGETKDEVVPVAFGLQALKIIFVVDEARGGTDDLEKEIAEIEGVNSIEVIDVRRALG